MTGTRPENPRRGPPGLDDLRPPQTGRSLPLDVLMAYAREVFSGMAENRDLRSEDGEPCVRAEECGQDGESTWIYFTADLSGIGMAMNSPLLVTSVAGAATLEWSLGPVPIAETPLTATPKEAADTLEMNALLIAFRRFVLAESTRHRPRGRG